MLLLSALEHVVDVLIAAKMPLNGHTARAHALGPCKLRRERLIVQFESDSLGTLEGIIFFESRCWPLESGQGSN